MNCLILQVLLAKQILRVKKRVTRNTVKDRITDLKNIAKRLRFLALEVMLSISSILIFTLTQLFCQQKCV